jgi:hypothetical protein
LPSLEHNLSSTDQDAKAGRILQPYPRHRHSDMQGRLCRMLLAASRLRSEESLLAQAGPFAAAQRLP